MLFAVVAFAGCESVNQSVPLPTIEIAEVEVSANSITIYVTATNAEECAYTLFDGDVITAEQILATGEKVAAGGALCTVKNLESDTTYYIAAAARNAAGEAMSNVLIVKTNAGGAGGNEDDNNDDNNDDNTGDGDFELPDIEGVENIVITKTKDGRWYEPYNYYVTFVRDNGDRIILDFYTLDETMSQYFPYGQYTFATNYYPYTIYPETSGYFPAGKGEGEGYNFTDGYVSVDVVNGYYAIYMMLTYEVDGESKSIQGYYNGILSGASVPEGDDTGSEELIEVLEVGATSFQFRINAEADQYWRCSVVDKRTYDQTQSNPGAWVVTYGFMLQGPLTFNWENGKICEYVPGLQMSVTSSTDYLIIAALMDYSEGDENSLLGGVEVVQIRTNAEAEGTGSVDMTITEVGANEVTFDCIFGDDVWCCYVAMMETANLQEIKDGKYAMAGYASYEECMLSLVPGLSHDFMRQFLESQYDYKWDGLKYGTSYTPCIKVVDMNNGAKYIELEPFTTSK